MEVLRWSSLSKTGGQLRSKTGIRLAPVDKRDDAIEFVAHLPHSARMTKSFVFALVSSATLIACGSPPQAWKATVSGSAAGVDVAPQGVLVVTSYTAERPEVDGETTVQIPAQYSLSIAITDKANTCQELTYRNDTPNQSYLSLYLIRKDGEPLAPGTYPISFWSDPETPAGARATAFITKTDGACKSDTDNDAHFAKTGSVTLTTLTKTEAAGSFDVTYASGTVSGTFSAPICRSYIPSEVKASFTCLP